MAWVAKSIIAAALGGVVVWAALPSPPPKYLGDADPLVRQQLPPMDTSAATGHTPLRPPTTAAAEGPGPAAPVAPSGPLQWVAPPLGTYVPPPPVPGLTVPVQPGIGAPTNDALPGTPGFPALLSQLVPACDLTCLAASVPPAAPPPPVILHFPPLPITVPTGP